MRDVSDMAMCLVALDENCTMPLCALKNVFNAFDLIDVSPHFSELEKKKKKNEYVCLSKLPVCCS